MQLAFSARGKSVHQSGSRLYIASPNRQRWLAIGKEHDNFSAHTASECLEERYWNKSVDELENMFSGHEASRSLLDVAMDPWFDDDLGVVFAHYKGPWEAAIAETYFGPSLVSEGVSAEIDLRAFSTLDKVKTEKCNELNEALATRPAPRGP